MGSKSLWVVSGWLQARVEQLHSPIRNRRVLGADDDNDRVIPRFAEKPRSRATRAATNAQAEGRYCTGVTAKSPYQHSGARIEPWVEGIRNPR
jgi:hypothetical protein